MTSRSRAPTAATRAPAATLALACVLVALAGCGGAPRGSGGPRAATAAFLDRLATGDVRGLCRSLSAAAVSELARDFGGASCPQTARGLLRYVSANPGEREAVRGVRILRNLDVPLSPAPYRAGSATSSLRLEIDDPVLHSRQAFDVGLRLFAGRWRVDAGIDAMFTILRDQRSGGGG